MLEIRNAYLEELVHMQYEERLRVIQREALIKRFMNDCTKNMSTQTTHPLLYRYRRLLSKIIEQVLARE